MYASIDERIIMTDQTREDLRNMVYKTYHRGDHISIGTHEMKILYLITADVISRSPILINLILAKGIKKFTNFIRSIHVWIEWVPNDRQTKTLQDKLTKQAKKNGGNLPKQSRINDDLLEIYITAEDWMILSSIIQSRGDDQYYYDKNTFAFANPLTKQEVKLLPTDIQNLNKLIKIFALDTKLKSMSTFTSLNHDIKNRVLNLEFSKQEFSKQTGQKLDLEPILNALNKVEMDKWSRKIESARMDLQDAVNLVDTKVKDYDNALKKMDDIMTDTKVIHEHKEKILRVLRDRRVSHIEISRTTSSTTLIIHTHPITLDYNKAKINHLRADLQLKIKEGMEPGIGRHIIKINLKNFNRSFIPKSNYKNFHIESHSCYGSFSSPIAEAVQNRNLAQLIFLLLQILSRATLGDSAGNRTMQDAYYMTPEKFIKYNDQDIYIDDFINQIENRGGNSNDYY